MENKIKRKFKYLPSLPDEEKVVMKYGSSLKDSFDKNKLKIIIWNVHKIKDKNFNKDFNELIKDADILLLQEYAENIEFIQSLIENNYNIVSAISFYSRKEIGTGVCTISSVENCEEKFIRSEVKEPFLKTPKLVLLSKYKVNNEENLLNVINVHAINFVNTTKFKKHIEQIEKEIGDLKGPILLGGDFNTWRFKRKKLLFDVMNSYGFKHIKFLNDKRRLKLDHVFIKNIKVIKAEILNNIKTSDHKPLLLEIEISQSNFISKVLKNFEKIFNK